MSSRRFEVQKKKLAVRRLSHGSKRSPLHSPTDEKRAGFKTKLSADDLRLKQQRRKRKLNASQRATESLQENRGQYVDEGLSDHGASDGIFIEKEMDGEKRKRSHPNVDPDLYGENPFIWERDGFRITKGGKPEEKEMDDKIEVTGSSNWPLAVLQPSKAPLISSTQNQESEISSTLTLNVADNPFAAALMEKPEFIPKFSGVNPFAALLKGMKGPGESQRHSFVSNLLSKKEKEEFRGADDVNDLTALRLRNVPDGSNNKTFLRNFYSEFGEIKRVYCHLPTKSSIITFADHASAASAKEGGSILEEGKSEVTIFWEKKQSQPRKPNASEENHGFKKITESGPIMKCSTMARNKQKIEKKDDEQIMPIALKDSVLELVRTFKDVVAEDAQEKFTILDKIDQKIREDLKRETDLTRAKAVIGICPDMCPEKERYLREDRRRLASFEILEGTQDLDTLSGEFPVVDHLKAIKEYSRPSADQEAPLCHELRSPAALKYTMDYIVVNIMDVSNISWNDWFDFVWNRMRSIRKDITQQHLCDEISVGLLEKCTRFHILCAHHLCEEDFHVFDQKINNENLTKCLQTLKHMYNDLLQEKEITCAEEAELRCYQILLNLNNAEVLREVMDFRTEVRDSAEVKFAIEVFRALNNSNYVRFFKLLRSASYLMACVMDRYFSQVRAKSLKIMNKAYGVSNRPIPVPVEDVTRVLAFEDDDMTAEFCQHYGFTVDEDTIYFSRSSYVEPELNFPTRKSKIIDEKRTCPLGEIVHGGPLPFLPECNQTVSFDEEGRYNGAYHKLALSTVVEDLEQKPSEEVAVHPRLVTPWHEISASALPSPVDTTTETTQVPVPVFQPVPSETEPAPLPPPPLPPPPVFKITREDFKEVCVDVLLSVICDMVEGVALETMQQVNEAMQAGNNIISEMISGEVNLMVRQIAAEVILTERKRVKDDRQRIINAMTLEISHGILSGIVSKNIQDVAMEVHREENQKLNEVIKERAVHSVGYNLLQEKVHHEIQKVCEEVINEEREQRKRRLQAIKGRLIMKRTGCYFARWLIEYNARKQIKEVLYDFPATHPLKSSPDLLRSLIHNPNHSFHSPDYMLLNSRSPLISLEKKQNDHKRSIEVFHRKIEREREELTKSLTTGVLFEPLVRQFERKGRRKQDCSFKLVISFPENTSIEANCNVRKGKITTELLKDKFRFGHTIRQDNCSVCEIETLARSSNVFNGIPIHFCIKAINGMSREHQVLLKKDHTLLGSSGILFVVYPTSKQNFWFQEKNRLLALVTSKPEKPSIPVFVLIVSNMNVPSEENIVNMLELDQLKEHGLCVNYQISFISERSRADLLTEKLCDALEWLAINAQDPFELKSKVLSNFIEDGLNMKFFLSLYDDSWERKQARLPPQVPHAIIDLYNCVLDHIAHVASSDRLGEYSWMPPEAIAIPDSDDVNWNDETTLKQIRDLIMCLRLPSLPEESSSVGGWSEQCEICLYYARVVTRDHQGQLDAHDLFNKIEQVLRRHDPSRKNQISYRVPSDFYFPWPEVIEQCIGFMLTSLQKSSTGRDINPYTKRIHFFEDKLKRFYPPDSWQVAVSVSKSELSQFMEESSFDSSYRCSSRETNLQKSINEVNDELNGIQERLDVSYSNHQRNSTPLQEITTRTRCLNDSVCEEKISVSRLSDHLVSLCSDVPINESTVKGTKRKRYQLNQQRHTETRPKFALGSKTLPCESLDKEVKRRRSSIEADINRLVKEVESARSATSLDETRWRSLLDD